MLPQGGHLECLKYLHEEVKAPWDYWTAVWAAANGHLHILEYLVERKYDKYNGDACQFAAWNGHLDCLKYLRNRQSALELLGRTLRAQERPPRMSTIPPRQRLFSPTQLAIRTWRAQHDLKSSSSSTKKEYEKGKQLLFSDIEIRE